MADRGGGVAVLRCGTDVGRVGKNHWGECIADSILVFVWPVDLEPTTYGLIERAFCVCGLARILLNSCVIASQNLARRGGGSRARADYLRTATALGSGPRSGPLMFAVD